MRDRLAGVALTGSGTSAAVAGCVLLGSGLAAGYPTLVALGIAGVAADLLALVYVMRRPDLRADRRIEPTRVIAGGSATARLVLTNTGRLPSPSFDAVDRMDSEPLRAPAPALKPGTRKELTYRVPAVHRGIIRLGPVTLERRDPLGLARRWAPLAGPAVLWVHPRVHATRPLPVGLTQDFDGRLAERAGSTAFSSLREYQPGDDPRAIHWRSTARAGTLVVRERVDTREPAVGIVVDTRSAGFTSGSFEAAVEFAASVAAAFRRAGRPVSLTAVGEDQDAVADAGGHDLMDRLAALRRAEDTEAAALLALIDQAPGGGCLIVVTGDTPGLAPAVATRRRRFSGVIMAQLGDELPDAVSRRSGVAVITACTAEGAARLFTSLSPGGVA